MKAVGKWQVKHRDCQDLVLVLSVANVRERFMWEACLRPPELSRVRSQRIGATGLATALARSEG
jgi:hypothetical protein